MYAPPEIIVEQFEHLPMASDIMGTGIDTTTMLAIGAMAAAGVSFRKLTPHWHETIKEGHLGVLFHRGQAVPKNLGTSRHLPGNNISRDFMRDFQLRWQPRRGHFVSPDELDDGVGTHVILPPNWYFVGPYNSIEPVNVADQPSEIKIPIDIRGDNGRRKIDAHVEMTWGINPDGDNPLLAITKVDHEMGSKKDSDDENKKRQKENMEIKNRLATGLAASGFVRAIYDSKLNADQLLDLSDENPINNLQENTVVNSASDLSRFGFDLRIMRLIQFTRSDPETHGDSLGKYFIPHHEDTNEAKAAAAAAGATVFGEDGAENVVYGPWQPKPAA